MFTPHFQMGVYLYGTDHLWINDHEPLSPPEPFINSGETVLTAGNQVHHVLQQQPRQQPSYHPSQ
jgi:hypothetical protein